MENGVYVDALAQVAATAQIGSGTKVWAYTRIQDHAVVGARCQFGQNVYVDRHVRIGRRVKVQNNVSIYAGVDVEDGVFLGPSCVFTNVVLPRAVIERKNEFAPTRVGRGATVGANATIVCGVTLGEFCLVGAGAVVSRDVVPFALVVGNRARRLGWVCACGERLPDLPGTHACARCSLAYDIGPDSCLPAQPDSFEQWWTARIGG